MVNLTAVVVAVIWVSVVFNLSHVEVAFAVDVVNPMLKFTVPDARVPLFFVPAKQFLRVEGACDVPRTCFLFEVRFAMVNGMRSCAVEVTYLFPLASTMLLPVDWI